MARYTFQDTLAAVEELVRRRDSSFFVTANAHYAMLTSRLPALTHVNAAASFVVADGMPLVWASRLLGVPLPERVAGADLFPALCACAAASGWRVFLLGGAPGVASAAAERLVGLNPGLEVVGVESPRAEELRESELIARIRRSRPDLLFAALGQPKGEVWVAQTHKELGVPVCTQVGAAFDFVAGAQSRPSPRFQRVGLEWAGRLVREPRRLGPRYAANAVFVSRRLASDLTWRAGRVARRS